MEIYIVSSIHIMETRIKIKRLLLLLRVSLPCVMLRALIRSSQHNVHSRETFSRIGQSERSNPRSLSFCKILGFDILVPSDNKRGANERKER
jgi:hypothetical protein